MPTFRELLKRHPKMFEEMKVGRECIYNADLQKQHITFESFIEEEKLHLFNSTVTETIRQNVRNAQAIADIKTGKHKMSDLAETTNEIETIQEETKAAAFLRLANPRVNSTLDKIRILGNLANRASYEYSQGQIDKIEAALTKAVTETMAKFRGKNEEEGFSL